MDEKKIEMLIAMESAQLRAALEAMSTEELRNVALAVANKLKK